MKCTIKQRFEHFQKEQKYLQNNYHSQFILYCEKNEDNNKINIYYHLQIKLQQMRAIHDTLVLWQLNTNVGLNIQH